VPFQLRSLPTPKTLIKDFLTLRNGQKSVIMEAAGSFIASRLLSSGKSPSTKEKEKKRNNISSFLAGGRRKISYFAMTRKKYPFGDVVKRFFYDCRLNKLY